ncbi:MAG: sulfatase-like hydrolase/transferase [Gemmatimonadaceae bacterium]
MIRRLRLAYPLLVAAYPTLWIASFNPGEFHSTDLLIVLCAVLILGGAVYAGVALVLRKHYSPEIIAAIAALVNGWFFLYLPASESLMLLLSVRIRHWYVVPFLAVPTLVLLGWMLFRRPKLESATTFLALMFFALVLQAAARDVYAESRALATIRRTSIAQKLADPIPRHHDGDGPNVRRDIYLLVFDMYANSQVLRDYLHFDNTPFEDSLRNLGFSVPSSALTNYSQTSLSLPSILNFEYVNEIKREDERSRLGENLSNYLVENNRTVRFLKEQGYLYVMFPSSWWKSTKRSPHADYTFFGWDTGILRQLSHTAFRRQVVNMTLLRWLGLSSPRGDGRHIARTFTAIADVANRPEPTFTFAHFMTPHRPFIVDANCGDLPESSGFRYTHESPEGARLYLAQLQCVNRRLLPLVRTLLARSDPAPIILIQGDHGTRTVNPTRGNPGDTITAAEVRERLGAFGAYYLPAGGGDALGDSVTAVNLMRFVLSYYAGADLPPLPDSLFYSLNKQVMKFFPVTVNGGRVPPT